MADVRVAALAELLVDRCMEVKAGDKVLLTGGVVGRPLLIEALRQVARRGAEPLLIPSFSEALRIVVSEMPEDRIDRTPELLNYLYNHVDAALFLVAPENTREYGGVPPERQQRYQRATQPMQAQNMGGGKVRWVICNYPAPALAQEAGMTTEEYENFVYGACLVDWDEMTARLTRLKQTLDGARTVEILGTGTELALSLEGRPGIVADGRRNMPDGEVFWAPIETRTQGRIRYDYPAIYNGVEVSGVELEFRDGRVVAARAERGEEFLLSVLDTDPGARVLGELGIGLNYGVQRFSKSMLFDEKMGGTVHLALGASIPGNEGQNVSAVHWDMLKDLRQQGEIRADGQAILKDGQFLVF
jgi:aminopeptidase